VAFLGFALLAVVVGGVAGPATASSGNIKGTSAPSGLNAATRAELSTTFDEAFAKVGAPGVIVGVQVGDKGAWKESRGVADTATNQAVTLDEHTRIGSLTKTFTGTLILQLVDEGKLRLSDTIEKWFPHLPDAKAITIRMLGNMSSGINTYTANPTLVHQYFSDPTRTWTPKQLVAAGTSLPRLFKPGHGFFYSDTNFVMLGMIIEQVTGDPYAEVLRTKILDPLNLGASSYPATTELPVPFWNGYTTQGSLNGQPIDATHWSPTIAAAAGQMVSTLDDLLVWGRAVGRGSLLTPQEQRVRLQGNPASKAGKREYDFAIGQDNGWIIHDGDIPGFNSQLAYLPKRDITIIVLVNSDYSASGAPPAATIFDTLAPVVAPSNRP
jgi:D-alanyl-D-alanine carboxypeptidase